MTPEEDRILRIVVGAVIAGTIVGFAPQVFRWLRRIGFRGWPLPPDSPPTGAPQEKKTR